MGYVLSINRDLTDGEYQPLNETGDKTFSVRITNSDVKAERTVGYTITGVSEADFGLSSLTGEFRLELVEPGPTETFAPFLRDTAEFTVTTDTVTEGLERFALSLTNEPQNVVRVDIADTSRASAGSLGLAKDEVRPEYFDNGTFDITLTATGDQFSDGDTIPFYVDGTAGQYISPSSGNFTLSGSLASQTFTKNIPIDSPLGDLFFEVKLGNGYSEGIQFPIFRERAPVSYDLVVSNPAPQRGDSFSVTLYTTGYDNGDQIPWSVVSGASQISVGGATGNFTVNASGVASHGFTVSGTAVDDVFRLRLDNGQAKVKAIIRNNDEVDLTVPTLTFPTLGSGVEQDQESGFQAIINELANLRKIPTPTALQTIAVSLDSINNNLTQNTTRNTAILQSIADQLKAIREDFAEITERATGTGIRTVQPFGELFLASAFKNLILEGGILDKNENTYSDANTREILTRKDSKPDKELKGESLKYLRELIAEAQDAIGDLE